MMCAYSQLSLYLWSFVIFRDAPRPTFLPTDQLLDELEEVTGVKVL